MYFKMMLSWIFDKKGGIIKSFNSNWQSKNIKDNRKKNAKPRIIQKHVDHIEYGNLPIRKYLVGGHYHVIVDEIDNKYISVGLTSDKPGIKRNQDLHKVHESNGKIARLKRNADFDYKNRYKKETANFHIDKESEAIAIKIGINKKAKKK